MFDHYQNKVYRRLQIHFLSNVPPAQFQGIRRRYPLHQNSIRSQPYLQRYANCQFEYLVYLLDQAVKLNSTIAITTLIKRIASLFLGVSKKIPAKGSSAGINLLYSLFYFSFSKQSSTASYKLITPPVTDKFPKSTMSEVVVIFPVKPPGATTLSPL